MTDRQIHLYWREWSAVRAADPKADRHQLHAEALGADKSHKEFDNADLDRVLGTFRAISKPGDLNAQLRQVRGEHRRLRFVLDGLVRQLGGDSNYIQGVVDQMFPAHEPDPDEPDRWQSERETAVARPRKLLYQLTIPDLKKVIIALRKQTRRRQAEGDPNCG